MHPALLKVRDRGAVGRVALAPVDERVPVQLVPHGRRTEPVPRPWITRTLGQAGERRVVDERAHGLARLLRRCPRTSSSSETSPRRHCDDLDRRLRLRLAAPRRPQPRERDPQPVAGRAHDLRLVALDRRDRAVHAEARRLDRIARRRAVP